MKVSGQSLPEYSLAVALIAIVAIAELTPLGKTLFNHFSTMGGQAKAINGSLSATSGSGTMPLGTNFSPGTGGTGGSFGAGNTTMSGNAPLPNLTGAYQGITVTLKNGTKLNFGQYPANPADMVETTGVSGTTSYLVGYIKTLADQLISNGSVTKSQYGALINLSNRGHDIGQVQNQIETLMVNNGGSLNGTFLQHMTIAGQSTYLSDSAQLTVEHTLKSLGCAGINPNDESLNLNDMSMVPFILSAEGIPSLEHIR